MPPKGSKKGSNPAPWWWEPAICELWADGGKDARRAKFYEEAVEALDAVYGGPELATAWTKSNWGSADRLFDNILKVRKWTVRQAREVAAKGGPVSYTHLRAHETPEHLVCRLLLEKKKKKT
eukprot:TRINITY_DN60117_c0_g1_i3.p1 TRINITY_DN60117_c0_g1~~TRINITY_DN60117_c0_g1_i3.p1  ORF type:complete len:122 (-),score=33.82 TRINITY_DN60117_c0_g1_i3:53-418(-)